MDTSKVTFFNQNSDKLVYTLNNIYELVVSVVRLIIS